MIETALRSHLTADAGVSGLVEGRIYPLVLPPQPTLPAVTYQRVSRTPVSDLSGVSHYVSRFQYSCWAQRYTQAKAVADAVRVAFEDYGGPMGLVRVLRAHSLNEVDLHDPETGLYHVPLDVLITHHGGEDPDE